jgi:outer membrane receptor for ferrienterochelin and colicins
MTAVGLASAAPTRGGIGRSARGLALASGAALVALSASMGWAQVSKQSARRQDLTTLSIEDLMQVQVVTGPSRYAQKASEAPSSVTVVSASEIKQYGYRTLADVLRSLSGFYITYDRNYAYVGIRGFGRPGDYNSRLLVLVDGHRVNDDVYDSVLVENGFLVDLDAVDRIEVVRGPNSSIYGSGAFFPVIVNVITKDAAGLGASLGGEAASFGTTKERASYARRFASGLSLAMAVAHSDSRGQRLYFPEFDTPATSYGVAEHGDGEHYSNALLKASCGEFSFEAVYALREKGIPTASFGTVFNDPGTRTWDENGFAIVKVDHAVDRNLSLLGQLSYNVMRYRGDYVTDYPPVTLNRDLAFGEWVTAEGLAVYRGIPNHTVLIGGEVQDNLHQDQRNFDLEPRYVYLNLRRSSTRWAVYAQDEVRLADHVIANLGLRYDKYDQSGGDASPRLAVIYIPSSATSVKILAGSANRPPNQYEAYYSVEEPRQEPNPGLQAERIDSLDVVLDQALGQRFRLTASGFLYRIRDLISLESVPSDDATQYQNSGTIRSSGIELEVTGDLGHGLRGRASYSYQNTRNVAAGGSLSNSPHHLLKLNMAVPLAGDRLSAGLDAQYTSSRLTLAGRRLGGFTVANLTLLGSRIFGRGDLSVTVYNLLDKRYADPGSEEHVEDAIQQDGRSYRVALKWHL